MNKPCNNCTINIKQYIESGEVYCYKTCKEFKTWQKETIDKYVKRN